MFLVVLTYFLSAGAKLKEIVGEVHNPNLMTKISLRPNLLSKKAFLELISNRAFTSTNDRL